MRSWTMDRLTRFGFDGGMTSLNPGLTVLTVVAATGAAAMGGVFFAFSGFVLAGLRRLPPAQGVAAMQAINVTAVRPPLMVLLFGTALVTVVVAVWGLRSGNPRAAVLVVAALLYLLGAVGVTAGWNVPLNDRLAALPPDAPDAAARWADYLRSWAAGNHVRATACLLSAAGFAVALRR
jgi:uncharacterized membrane protein